MFPLGLRLVLYLPCDHVEIADQVSQVFETYLRSVSGPSLPFSEYSLGGETTPLREDGWTRIRDALSPPRGERFLEDEDDEAYVDRRVQAGFQRMVQLSSLDAGVSGFGFFYWARLPWREPVEDEVSLMSVSWPTEYLAARGAAHLRTLLIQLASLLPFSSGHAGLAFSSPNLHGPPLERVRDEALRYPGVEVTHGQRFLGAWIDGVHWLNFLGPDALTAQGGVEALRARLRTPGTLFQEMPGRGALVTLGAEPDAGDLAQGRRLPAYRELAHVLEATLLPCPPQLTWRGWLPEEPRRWWRRFLD